MQYEQDVIKQRNNEEDHRGVSQTVHLSVALAGFDRPQVEHGHVVPETTGCLIPAAAQSKLFEGGALVMAGLAASQIVHLSTTDAGLERPHIEQFQLVPEPVLGAFIPAAAKSKPFDVGALTEADFGASQIVHLSIAVAGLDKLHVEHVQLVCVLPLLGAFIPAADQSKVFTAGAAVAALDDPATA